MYFMAHGVEEGVVN